MNWIELYFMFGVIGCIIGIIALIVLVIYIIITGKNRFKQRRISKYVK